MIIEKHETFSSPDGALECKAQHEGAEIIKREGCPIYLNGRMTYKIPESRTFRTVWWDEEE